MDATIKSYDVRLQRIGTGGRMSVRVAAVDPAEARAQCAERFSEYLVVACRRSKYACGLAERRRREEWVSCRA